MRDIVRSFAPLLLVLWALSPSARGQEDGSFWWLRDTTNSSEDITPPPVDGISQPPCECVKYYLCVNGTISTSGAGIIDLRMGSNNPPPPPPRNRNAPQCPDLYDVCCAPPPPLTTTPTTTPYPTLPPDTPCECVPFINCTGERIVSDGKGDTSLEAFGLYASHSSCPHAFSVCCALEPTPIPATLNDTYSPTHPHCDCVETFMCDATGTIVTSGAGLMDLRTMYPNPNPNITCDDPRKICCNLPPDAVVHDNTTMNATTTPQPTTDDLVEEPLPSCGTRNSMGIVARILGFKEGESQFGEFPWVAAILRLEMIMEKPVFLFVGGGTLVHPRILVTAAHKVATGARSNKFWVRLGEWDTQTTQEPHPHQSIEVEEVVIHPEYNPRTLFNDIAILILKSEFERAPHINHICLAEDLEQVDTNVCIINGWGKDSFEETGTHQLIMKSLTLPLVQHQQCQNQLRKTRLGRYFRLDKSFTCAGGELGKDACTGDGGGPLACARKDDPTRYLLVGITAWGIGCGQDGIPGVYASIPANYQWIVNETYGRFPVATTTVTTTTSTTETPTTTEEFLEDLDEYYYYDQDELEEEPRGEKRRRQERERRKERNRNRRQRERRERRKEERKRRREEMREEMREERREERRQERREERRERRLGKEEAVL